MTYDFYLEFQWETYYKARNIQIAYWKLKGCTWGEIADRVGLSRDYVKDLARKLGVYGDKGIDCLEAPEVREKRLELFD